MWQYQNTDELYHSNMYKNINKNLNNELYHSDVYLGKDYSDGIKHYKYIKREKVNGRWRYYYKNDKLDQLGRKKKRSVDNYNAMEKAYETSLKNYKKGDRNIDIVLENRRYANKLDKESSENVKEYNIEKQKDDKRRIKYEKYLINPLNKASNAVYKGKQKVGLLINKIKNRKTKGKA